MKKYDLILERTMEFEGYSVLDYYSKGHHDKTEFLSELERCYDLKGDIDKVHHIYAKLTPAPTGGLLMNYRTESCKGSFPVTVTDEVYLQSI